jgi:hypothetical protein
VVLAQRASVTILYIKPQELERSKSHLSPADVARLRFVSAGLSQESSVEANTIERVDVSSDGQIVTVGFRGAMFPVGQLADCFARPIGLALRMATSGRRLISLTPATVSILESLWDTSLSFLDFLYKSALM